MILNVKAHSIPVELPPLSTGIDSADGYTEPFLSKNNSTPSPALAEETDPLTIALNKYVPAVGTVILYLVLDSAIPPLDTSSPENWRGVLFAAVPSIAFVNTIHA